MDRENVERAPAAVGDYALDVIGVETRREPAKHDGGRRIFGFDGGVGGLEQLRVPRGIRGRLPETGVVLFVPDLPVMDPVLVAAHRLDGVIDVVLDVARWVHDGGVGGRAGGSRVVPGRSVYKLAEDGNAVSALELNRLVELGPVIYARRRLDAFPLELFPRHADVGRLHGANLGFGGGASGRVHLRYERVHSALRRIGCRRP